MNKYGLNTTDVKQQ